MAEGDDKAQALQEMARILAALKETLFDIGERVNTRLDVSVPT